MSEDLEIQRLVLFSLPEAALSLFGDHQIIYYKHNYFCCYYFFLICNIPSPKPPVRSCAEDTARGSIRQNSRSFWYSLLRRGCKGQGKKTRSSLLRVMVQLVHPTRQAGSLAGCQRGPLPPSSVCSAASGAPATP